MGRGAAGLIEALGRRLGSGLARWAHLTGPSLDHMTHRNLADIGLTRADALALATGVVHPDRLRRFALDAEPAPPPLYRIGRRAPASAAIAIGFGRPPRTA